MRQGEVDNIEREEGGNTIEIVKRVVQLFAQRCATAGVSEDLGEHMAKVLESHDVFEPPLRCFDLQTFMKILNPRFYFISRRMARELRDARDKERAESASNA